MDPAPSKPRDPSSTLPQQVEKKESRKVKARQQRSRSLWFGLGLSGLIGWSVAIPTLLGTRLGLWLDHRFPSSLSWTLMLMAAGLILGCWNAWIWLRREGQQ